MKPIHALAVLFQLFAMAGTGLGQVGLVYDNHVSTVNNGRVNDPDFPAFLMHADDFSLPTNRMINRLSWLGAYKDGDLLPDGDDDFTIRFFAFHDGIPDTSPLATFAVGPVARLITPQTLFYGNPVFSFSASIPDLQLAAGTYLLAIMNDPVDDDLWLWADADASQGHSYLVLNEGTPWREYAGGGVAEFAFSMAYAPEPSVSVLVFVGGLLLGARRSWHSSRDNG